MSFETSGTLDMSTAPAKRESYRLLRAQAEALLHGERDWLANLAQFAALVYGAVPGLNWAGFYMARDEELVLGPFQGKVACVRIAFSRAFRRHVGTTPQAWRQMHDGGLPTGPAET